MNHWFRSWHTRRPRKTPVRPGLEVLEDRSVPSATLVQDVNPGTANGFTPYNNGGFASYLTDVNGELYFAANDGVHGVELWKSDGTPGNTLMVADINPTGDSLPHNLINVN